MATGLPPPAPQVGQSNTAPLLGEGKGTEASQALVPAPGLQDLEEPLFGPLVLALPVEVDVTIPIRNFRVRRLLALAPGQVIESQWVNGTDLPLSAGDTQLAWTEFEVVATKLAVRVTRVA